MKILLTGANGQVGWEIARQAGNHSVLALDHAALDIGDATAVQATLTHSAAELVINAAAYTAVDRAEQEPERALAGNRDGPRHLATACAQRGIPLLHLSTDYVFDGNKPGPYTEDDPIAPLGVYGRSKWEGEQAVRQTLAAHLILRVSWVFGEHGHNFVKTLLRLAREREQLRVVADQQGCPTYAGAIAEVLLALADRIATGQPLAWGTYHYCGTPATTWHGFAETIVRLARAYEPLRVREVVPITTADYPTPAARPANSVLDCTRWQRTFGWAPQPWQDGLAAMLRALYLPAGF
jgi:dTDP-4-dehydrorhamnose reductase